MDNKNENQFVVPVSEQKHKAFAHQHPVGMMSAENPYIQGGNKGGHNELVGVLSQAGMPHMHTHGKYNIEEPSVLVDKPTREQMFELGHHFGQESVIYGENGKHEMIFTHGPNAGKWVESIPEKAQVFKEPPQDYYTHIPDLGYLRLAFDNTKLHEPKLTGAAAEKAAKVRSEHEQKAVNKSEPNNPAHNLALVRQESEGSNSVADEKEYNISEVRLALAKAMKDRVQKYAEEMRQLRSRELQLQKAEAEPVVKSFEMRWAEFKALNKSYAQKSATMEIDKNLSMGYGELTTNPPAGGPLSLSEPLSKPPVSEAQRRAMGAAASGDSTLGIPKKVGEKFIEEDKGGKLPEKQKKSEKMCKMCNKSHSEDMEKCDMANVEPAKKSDDLEKKGYGKKEEKMWKDVSSVVVHDAKATKAPKDADYESKQSGASAVYESKKPGIFGKLAAKKMDKCDTADVKIEKREEEKPKTHDLEQVGTLPGDKPSKKVKIKDGGSGGEIKSVKKSSDLMNKVKGAAGKVKNALTDSNQKRADAMPEHGFNKQGKPAYLDKADAPMAKPPSGKNMATATPVASNTSKPGLSKNAMPKLPGMKPPKLPKVSPTATAQVRANAPAPEQTPPSNETK